MEFRPPFFMAMGATAYIHQLDEGLIVTSMRDQASWEFHTPQFHLSGRHGTVAALLVIPAYVYHWKPIKEIVILESSWRSWRSSCASYSLPWISAIRAVGMHPLYWATDFPSSLLAVDVVLKTTRHQRDHRDPHPLQPLLQKEPTSISPPP